MSHLTVSRWDGNPSKQDLSLYSPVKSVCLCSSHQDQDTDLHKWDMRKATREIDTYHTVDGKLGAVSPFMKFKTKPVVGKELGQGYHTGWS